MKDTITKFSTVAVLLLGMSVMNCDGPKKEDTSKLVLGGLLVQNQNSGSPEDIAKVSSVLSLHHQAGETNTPSSSLMSSTAKKLATENLEAVAAQNNTSSCNESGTVCRGTNDTTLNTEISCNTLNPTDTTNGTMTGEDYHVVQNFVTDIFSDHSEVNIDETKSGALIYKDCTQPKRSVYAGFSADLTNVKVSGKIAVEGGSKYFLTQPKQALDGPVSLTGLISNTENRLFLTATALSFNGGLPIDSKIFDNSTINSVTDVTFDPADMLNTYTAEITQTGTLKAFGLVGGLRIVDINQDFSSKYRCTLDADNGYIMVCEVIE